MIYEVIYFLNFFFALLSYQQRLAVSSETDVLGSTICITILSDSDQRPVDTEEIWEKQLQATFKDFYITSSHNFSDLETRVILPIIPKLYRWYGDKCGWFMFVTPHTAVNSATLKFLLSNYEDPASVMYYLGHSLQDHKPSIIHHFLFSDKGVDYPLGCSGFLLSNMAIMRVSQNIINYKPDFTIDPLYELSLFLKYMRLPSLPELHRAPLPADEDGVVLIHVPMFCPDQMEHCCTHCTKEPQCSSPAWDPVLSDVVFAVKTCEKYHSERLPIMWETWTGNPSHLNIRYFSDSTDDNFNTIDTGVENTERGHCSKLLSILHHMSQDMPSYSWLVVCDDDTLMSVPRLMEFLTCYDASSPLILGEMYGYNVHRGNGYLYPTGGSGIVFSRRAVEIIVQSGVMCPSHDYPDDMFIGSISTLKLNIKLVHSSLFHQDQPQSYNPILLQSSLDPISFHRHKPMNPFDVFRHYLYDEKESSNSEKLNAVKTEL